jgi:hypothetical protein
VEPWKAREVRVGCVELDPMLDGQSGKMGVSGEIPSGPDPSEEIKKNLSVVLSRMNEGHLRPGKPRSHDPAGPSNR